MNKKIRGTASIALVAGVALTITACGGTKPAATAAAPGSASSEAEQPQQPFDVEKAMAREAEGLKEVTIKSPDGKWSTSTFGSGAPKIEAVEADVVVTIPVAPDNEIACRVYEETVDSASTLSGLLKQVGEKLQYQHLALAPIQLHSGFPAAGVTALYTVQVEGGKAIGRVHTAIYRGEQRSALCFMDDAGYAETFARVSGAFFAGLRTTGPASNATWLEVSKTSIDSVDVGFSVTTVAPADEANERVYSTVSSTFMPRSKTEFLYEDSYVVLRLDAKGKTRLGTWAKAQTGEELSLHVNLTRDKDGKLDYEGQVGGKPIKGTLAAPKGLTNSLEVAALLKQKLAKGGAFEETVAEYHPSIDPTALVNVTYSRKKDAPPRQIVMRLGDRDFVGDVDENGVLANGSLDLGKQKLSITRQRVVGKP